MEVTVTTISVSTEDDPVLLSVKAKDTTRQFHLERGSRTLRFPWALSGELRLQLLKEVKDGSETIVLDRYLEQGAQEDRVDLGDTSFTISVLPAAPRRRQAASHSGASERDRDRKYLEDSGLAELLSEALAQIMQEKPQNPVGVLISALQSAVDKKKKKP